jgi:hypothetical protein
LKSSKGAIAIPGMNFLKGPPKRRIKNNPAILPLIYSKQRQDFLSSVTQLTKSIPQIIRNSIIYAGKIKLLFAFLSS